jgi:pyrroloquinoline quinone biosynthesis protein E
MDKGLGNTTPQLKELKLEVTYRCPLQCIHCSSEASSASPLVMSPAAANRILGQAAAMGVREIAFSGGEPLLWRDLPSAVLRCSDLGMEPVVYSSGNVEHKASAMDRLHSAGAVRVIFSLLGGSPAAHDRMTGTAGSFAKTLECVEEANTAGLEFEFHFVPMSQNYQELPAVVSIGRAKGAVRVSVLRFVPQGRGKTEPGLALSRKQNLRLRRMILGAGRNFEIRTGSPYNFLLVNSQSRCLAATDRLSIAPDQSIYPCDAFKQIKSVQICGTDKYSRLDAWSLRECWEESPYLRAVRRSLGSGVPPTCSVCSLLAQCGSGCLAQKFIAYGSLRPSADPMCLARIPASRPVEG